MKPKWEKINEIPSSKFAAYAFGFKPKELNGLRFILHRKNLVYVSNFLTFGDIMPDKILPNETIEIWSMGE